MKRLILKEGDLRRIVRRIISEGSGKEYWGIGGAGLVFVCPEDGTVFLQKRSAWVTGGAGQWAFPGGGIHADRGYERHWMTPIPEEYVLGDEDPRFEETAEAEVEEECGSLPSTFNYMDSYLYEDGGFKYKTFVAAVPLRAKESWHVVSQDDSSWESEGAGWFDEAEFSDLEARGKLFFGFTPQLKTKIRTAMNR